MYQNDQIYSHRFPILTIGDDIVIILEGDIGNRETGQHNIIISHNLDWCINKNSDHSELVAHFHGQLHGDSNDNHL